MRSPFAFLWTFVMLVMCGSASNSPDYDVELTFLSPDLNITKVNELIAVRIYPNKVPMCMYQDVLALCYSMDLPSIGTYYIGKRFQEMTLTVKAYHEIWSTQSNSWPIPVKRWITMTSSWSGAGNLVTWLWIHI